MNVRFSAHSALQCPGGSRGGTSDPAEAPVDHRCNKCRKGPREVEFRTKPGGELYKECESCRESRGVYARADPGSQPESPPAPPSRGRRRNRSDRSDDDAATQRYPRPAQAPRCRASTRCRTAVASGLWSPDRPAWRTQLGCTRPPP